MVLQKARSPIASLAAKQALWAPAYARVQSIIGITTGVIVPMGDPNHEAAGTTTVTTKGVEQFVYTYSEARSAFDTPIEYRGPGQVPIIAFNGSDEQLDTPDDNYWSRDDSSGEGMSLVVWMALGGTSGNRVVWAKNDSSDADSNKEWQLFANGAEKLIFILLDQSEGVQHTVTSDDALTIGELVQLVIVYDGSGGATGGNGVTMYKNGAVLTSGVSNNGSYVAMKNLGQVVEIGSGSGGLLPYNGTIAGGPLGPAWTTAQLTANQVKALYQTGREMLGV